MSMFLDRNLLTVPDLDDGPAAFRGEHLCGVVSYLSLVQR